MKRSLIILSILAMFMMGFSTVTFAQPKDTAKSGSSSEHSMILEGGINLPFPDGWERSESSGKAIVSLKEDKIEVYHRKMVLENSATTLFEQFTKYLDENGLVTESENDMKTYSLSDGNTREGRYYIHKYTSNDITISVHSYCFTSGLHAYIVVGYFIKAEQETGVDAFDKMLGEMTLDSDN